MYLYHRPIQIDVDDLFIGQGDIIINIEEDTTLDIEQITNSIIQSFQTFERSALVAGNSLSGMCDTIDNSKSIFKKLVQSSPECRAEKLLKDILTPKQYEMWVEYKAVDIPMGNRTFCAVKSYGGSVNISEYLNRNVLLSRRCLEPAVNERTYPADTMAAVVMLIQCNYDKFVKMAQVNFIVSDYRKLSKHFTFFARRHLPDGCDI